MPEQSNPLQSEIVLSTLYGKEAATPVNYVAVFTGGLLFLAVLTICYFAAEIILPICVALTLNLVLRPVVRALHAIKVPHTLSALLIIVVLVGIVAGFGAALSGPAAEWGERLPGTLPQLQERLHFLIEPVHQIQKTVNQAENATSISEPNTMHVVLKNDGLSNRLFNNTRLLAGEILEILLILFFLLLAGDTFQQRFIEILPRIQDKKKALQISEQIEEDIAAYLRTITLMNFIVGGATTGIMFFCGIPNPVLWGAIAFLFNYVPILGPLAATCLFVLVGMLSNENLGMAVLPACLYFFVHLIEGEVATPLILSNRFTINPALVILMLVVWFWMWGVAGAILATPMLAIVKIICDRTTGLKALGHLIEG